jgi:hypothetical protein
MIYACCVCLGKTKSAFNVSFIYLSLNISPYLAASHAFFLSGLGINRHVCELQLTLKEFVALRSLDGHKRYVAFRNTRCE